ncbi:nucleotidyltransferase [bacterium]|nr:MAG: nucleotidyltransferase [bacterium]
MKAVVMAGGYGTRLRPLTVKLPKPMIPIANRPMLEHIIRLLREHGIDEIIMLTYFFPDTIEEYFGDGSSLGVKISYRQDPPGGLGTAGAVKNVEDLIEGPFLVISGDVITDFDLTRAMDFHTGRDDMATMVLTRVHNPLPFGVVITDDDDRVVRFLEKPSWGEVFSDTINTGIYILEPKIFDLIPKGIQRDFSKDIFPALLEKGTPPGAFVAEGHWKDVGNAVEYLQIHREITSGTVELDVPGDQVTMDGATVFLGKDCTVHPDARLSGMIVIGDGATIEDEARVRDCFIGSGCRIGSRVRMRASVLWSEAEVEEGAFVAGSVLGGRTKVKMRANVEEGSIVGEDCVIGRGSIVRAGVRVWPDKVVEDDAVLSTHFVWGTRWRGTLFTSGIIRGMSNKEITPEFAARLGASFGATLPENSVVSMSRGMHRAARMINEALSSGVLSVGVDVQDYGVTPIPVSRYQMAGQDAVGGIHVRRSPSDPETLEIRLFREDGRELTTAERNEVDRLFFRMDFRRANTENSGELSHPYYGIDSYVKGYLKRLDIEAMARAKMRVVVDYSNGSTLKVLPSLLGRTKTEVVSLNAHLDEERETRTTKEFDRAVRHITDVVTGLKANLGVMISASGESMFLIDEKGRWIDGGKMLQVMALLVFMTEENGRVAVPASASGNNEKIAAQNRGVVIRTPIHPAAILDGAVEEGAFMAGNTEGGFAFPGFHPSFDAMFSLGKLMEMLAVTDSSLGDIVDRLPDAFLEHSVVPCAWEAKGQVMRLLVEELGEEAKGIEGVRFDDNGGWVLIYPSSNHACFHIFAENATLENVREVVRRWSRKVEEMQF